MTTRRLLAALLLAAARSFAQSTPQTQTLLATPTTVAWGFYSAHAKPALTVHSGDTVIMQTASTCGSPERLESEGVPPAQIPTWLDAIYKQVPKDERGPGGHILTGPVAIAEADQEQAVGSPRPDGAVPVFGEGLDVGMGDPFR